MVDVETQTVSTDKTILSAGLAKSSGQLNAQARLEIFAKHLTRLDNDFSAGGTGEVVIGTDSGIPCPIPAPTLEARTDGAPQELVLRPVAIIDG